MKKLVFLAAVFGVVSSPVFAQWSAESIAIGQRDHPKIMARFGGAIAQENLSQYVSEIGQIMADQSSRRDEDWTFTILDSPDVNAFALPGGYVYITRGLLALANNEAELAAVLAHEITHVIENHVENREIANQNALIDGALGALAQGIFSGGGMGNALRDNIETALADIGANSQEQEYAADRGGIILLARAGYDPHAQADFLAAMAANSALRAKMAGRGYDPETVPFFANHPAPVEREIVARALAETLDGDTNRDRYLARIDGLLFGDSTAQGYVRGQVFSHPELGFTFVAADGFQIKNTPRQINIIGPQGATLVMTGAPDNGTALTDYVKEWANSLPRRDRVGRRQTGLRNFFLNGMEAATVRIGYRRGARRGDMQLTVIRFNNRLIRFAGFSRSRDSDNQQAMLDTVRSFSALDNTDLAPFTPQAIEIYRVRRRDTIASLSARFPRQEFGEDLFRVLNHLPEPASLTRGDLVKIIVEAPQ